MPSHRVVIRTFRAPLLILSFLVTVLVIAHLRTDVSIGRSGTPAESRRLSAIRDSNPISSNQATWRAGTWSPSWFAQNANKLSSHGELWADIPVRTPEEFWAWTKEENRRLGGVSRRASWGGLKSQGAKSTVKENLRDDKRYFLTGPIGGFSNQFMTFANAIYAARASDRIPILFPFRAFAGQIGGYDHDIPISSVFDLNRLVLTLNGPPIIELHELRQYDDEPEYLKSAVYDGEFAQTASDGSGRPLEVGQLIPAEELSPEGDKVGCWSWGQGYGDDHFGSSKLFLKGTSFIPLPPSAFAPGRPDQHARDLSDLGKFIQFVTNTWSVPEESLEMLDALGTPRPELLPDPHLFCTDDMFWYRRESDLRDVGQTWNAGEGVWAAIGRHMRFQPSLVRLADDYLRHVFGLQAGDDLPPFFAVHIRRGDFNSDWLAMGPDHWAHAVWEAVQDLRLLGVEIQHIIFATDEQDPAWRAPLLKYGWHFVDHEEAGTADRFGHWSPTLLDTVLLSRATGFLGGSPSSMSMQAYRRVVDWNGGLGRWMDWGHQLPADWAWTWG